MANESICLNCILTDCSEDDPQCLYSQFVKAERQRTRETRREAINALMRGHYERNKEAEKARVAKWQRENRDKVNEKQKRYDHKRRTAVLDGDKGNE